MPLEVQAILWDNEIRIEGKLVLRKDSICFNYESAGKSGLKLEILKNQILAIEEYLLFGIERKGLLIRSGNDRIDRFIVNNPREVRKTLLTWLSI